VLGLYGGSDARINATIPATDSTMKQLKKGYEFHIFEGAGHGFLRGQDQSPANLGMRHLGTSDEAVKHPSSPSDFALLFRGVSGGATQ